jgi:hypothetical protein
MLIVRGNAQTMPSERNTAPNGELWFDPILPKTDGVDVGSVVFSPNGRTVWHQHENGSCSRSRRAMGSSARKATPHSGCAPATRYGSRPTSGTGTAPAQAR